MHAKATQFRISSNAIYPFACEGRTQFLRLAPTSEKLERNIRGEIAFVAFLIASGYPAHALAPSARGNLLETIEYNGEMYFAVVSARVPGVRMDAPDCPQEAFEAYGRALGQLHALSATWRPQEEKWSCFDALRWSAEALADAPDALREADIVAAALEALPKTAASYGLVHYDFELDNVFYDAETDTCHAIDFDDGMMHFYAMDIDQALDSIRDELPQARHAEAETAFLRGYGSAYDVDEDMLRRPVFRRFANLYGYARILRATRETFADEPDWMTALRGHLDALMARRSAEFGKPL